VIFLGRKRPRADSEKIGEEEKKKISQVCKNPRHHTVYAL
jgi:hypothetical protein